MPRSDAYWQHSFTASERLRDAERAKDEGGEACVRGNWCAGRRIVTEDGERKIIPAKSYSGFCPACRGVIARCLEELPAASVRLVVARRDKQSRGEQEIRVPFGPSVPLRLDCDYALRLISDLAASWHERVAHVARLSVPDTQRVRCAAVRNPAGVTAAAVPVLAAHINALLALERGPMTRLLPLLPTQGDAPEVASSAGDVGVVMLSGVHAGGEILSAEYLARAILAETPPKAELLLGVPCRSCDHLALRRADPPWRDGDPDLWSACMHCRDTMTADEYKEWTARNAAFYRHRPETREVA